ncbi:MAG: NUDIX hydrolase [Candidatus Moranbacteria bacterium]|nr:NUDIX hydrolase [Candidatus Moranbacteria bacterium]
MPKIIIASGPVIVEDNKVLLNQHGDTEFWKFCGGKVENYETTLIENAKREVMEEMGIEIEILDEKPFLIHTTKETADGTIDVILVHYLAKRIGEITPGADIREWKWIPLSELEKENLAPNILPTLKHFGFITTKNL